MTETPARATPMGEGAPPPLAVEDAAWIRVPTSFPPQMLAQLISDPEVLLRLNPYYIFKLWRRTGPNTYQVEFENNSNQQQLALDLTVTPGPGQGLTVAYAQGLKRRTVFSIEAAPHGGILAVTDDYEGLPEAQRREREAEVDKSLVAWGEALRTYFLRQKRYRWVPGWRWYIRRAWIPMKPSARRIVWLLYLIAVVEFFFFLFVLAIYLLEHNT